MERPEKRSKSSHTQHDGQNSKALRIAIDGTIISGLIAAVALGRQGHQVTLIESEMPALDTSKDEILLQLPPCTTTALRKLEVDPEKHGAVPLSSAMESSPAGKILSSVKWDDGQWLDPWLVLMQRELRDALLGIVTAASNSMSIHLHRAGSADSQAQFDESDLILSSSGEKNLHFSSVTSAEKPTVLLRNRPHGSLACLDPSPMLATEDAMMLAGLLSAPSSQGSTDIEKRLLLFNKLRNERTANINASPGSDPTTHLLDLLTYDAHETAVHALRLESWKSSDVFWRMPIEFGPLPGPRQQHNGLQHPSAGSSFFNATIRFTTPKSILQSLFPNRPGFRIRTPGNVAQASFMAQTFSGLHWLGGGGYNLFGLYIHDVEYTNPETGKVTTGMHCPVLFEDLADPVLSGREEIGVPKLFGSVEVVRRQRGVRVNVGWEGAVWGRFAWEGCEEVVEVNGKKTEPRNGAKGEPESKEGEKPVDGLICWRYIPKVGLAERNNGAEADYAVVCPPFAMDYSNPTEKDSSRQPRVTKTWKAETAEVKVDKMDQMALPTIHHIVERIADIPILSIVSATLVEGSPAPDASAAVRVQ